MTNKEFILKNYGLPKERWLESDITIKQELKNKVKEFIKEFMELEYKECVVLYEVVRDKFSLCGHTAEMFCQNYIIDLKEK